MPARHGGNKKGDIRCLDIQNGPILNEKKGKNDAVRGKITTKISREITIAVRMGGADPTGNMRLKLALQKAKENNIPKENINRAIQKGAGTLEGQSYEEIV